MYINKCMLYLYFYKYKCLFKHTYKCIFYSPWRKPLKEYQKKTAIPGFGNVKRVEIYSVNKTWTLVDDERVRICI